MHKSIFFTILSVFSLSVVATPVLSDHSLTKRGNVGKATWFYVSLGACGWTNVDSDLVLALSPDFYNSGEYCGQSVTITDTTNGVTATGTVVDLCPGCSGNAIDLSIGLFEQFDSNLNDGVLEVVWNFS